MDKEGGLIMKTIQLQLEPQTIQQAEQVAQYRDLSLERLISEIIEKLARMLHSSDPLWGLFADEPELIDQIVEAVLQARESHPVRTSHE